MVVITRCARMRTPRWADLWLCHCGKASVVINCVSELTFARPFFALWSKGKGSRSEIGSSSIDYI